MQDPADARGPVVADCPLIRRLTPPFTVLAGLFPEERPQRSSLHFVCRLQKYGSAAWMVACGFPFCLQPLHVIRPAMMKKQVQAVAATGQQSFLSTGAAL